MRDYPAMADHRDSVEPVPRRLRGYLAGQLVFDTVAATYVWDHVRYPQYHIPLTDTRGDLLVAEDHIAHTRFGDATDHTLRVADTQRPRAARLFGADAPDGVANTVRFTWTALDAWFEEDEQVFVHPRNPYTRVDALRSDRHVRVELDGATLAESSTTVMVFETGLPTRYYFERTAVDFAHLTPTDTISECPYNGRTSGYWTAHTGGTTLTDAAWSYDFPTRQLLPITGLIAFYNEKLDITIDGRALERPTTPFS